MAKYFFKKSYKQLIYNGHFLIMHFPHKAVEGVLTVEILLF